MAARNKPVEEEIVENISVESLDGVMGDRYAIYAKYVIQDRAIPDVRDGLKPVQRRIIFSMYQNGNTYDKPTKKCAKIVGDVMGRFHPHGDTSIYDALVRLSQSWKMSMPLVTFQGNNGSIDNDPAAAYRYTEAKLNEFSETLINDIEKNTVDMTLNFDDTEFEPVVLPCRYPNLFVNGSEGIAVAIATEIPPHNLTEICEAAIHYIQHPKCSLDDLLEIVKGPDFPTGGVIYECQGIRDIYETGRGKIEIASKVTIDDSNKNYNELVISEIPYGVVKQNLAYQIDKIKKSHEIDGINEVRDLSSGDEIKICVELKKEVDPNIVLAYLMSKTQLKVSYSSNIVAICDNHPRTLGLLSYLDYYTKYQIDVITRKFNFDLKKVKDRLHIVEGLIKSVSIINEIIAIIRKSADKADSKKNLMNAYGFSEIQAEAIVTMRLYKLSNTDVRIYVEEKAELEKTIAYLEETLADENKIRKVIVNHLKAIIKKFGIPRRTVIETKKDEIQIDKRDLIVKEDVYVVVTKDGYVKRSSLKSYKSSNGALPGVKQNDVVIMNQILNTADYILAFTNKGNYIIMPVHEILEGKWKDEGKHINYMCNLPLQESLIRCIVVKNFEAPACIAIVTKNSQVKKTLLSDFYTTRTSKPVCCMRLTGNDEVADVAVLYGNSNIYLSTESGRSTTYFNENAFEPTKLKTCGVKGISTLSKSTISRMLTYRPGEKSKLVIVTDKGFVKIADSSNFVLTDRLGRTGTILESFKTSPHLMRCCFKLKGKPTELTIHCLMKSGEMKDFTIKDFYLTPQDKHCITNLEGFNKEKDVIEYIYNDEAEVIEANVKADAPIKMPSETPTLIKSSPKSQENDIFYSPDKKQTIKIVKIDDSSEEPEEENYEQISIFDEMGD